MPELLQVLREIPLEARPQRRKLLGLLQLNEKEGGRVAGSLDADVRPQLLVEDFDLFLFIDIELVLETLLKYVVDKSANFSFFVIRAPRPTLAFFDHS
jgi:hypothetical protein